MAAVGHFEVQVERGDGRVRIGDLGAALRGRRRLDDREGRRLPAGRNVVEERAGSPERLARR